MVASPDGFAPEAECTAAADVRSVAESQDAAQVLSVAVAPPDDYWAGPSGDDHFAPVALPVGNSAPAD